MLKDWKFWIAVAALGFACVICTPRVTYIASDGTEFRDYEEFVEYEESIACAAARWNEETQTWDCELYQSEMTPGLPYSLLEETPAPTQYAFSTHNNARTQIDLAITNNVLVDASITVHCTGDERYWQSTLGKFRTELNNPAPFGVPDFCPNGGYFEVTQ